MHVRMVLTVVALAALLVSGAAVAFASPTSMDMVGPGGASAIADDGGSRWWYQDLTDIEDGVVKSEGGYLRFDGTNDVTRTIDGIDYAPGEYAIYDDNPHGGYDSSTNKCKVCHAVHRAEGAYYLLRSDTQDDACSYCHIGGSARSRLIVYDLNEDGIFTSNGHTIGASSVIPGSSVEQELVTVTLKTVDADMNEQTEDVQVRRYAERRNQMFRFAQNHGQSAPLESEAPGTHPTMQRVGPLALRCMNCHQPHNAANLVWKPVDTLTNAATDGYKLLRLSPSGSVADAGTADDMMHNVEAGFVAPSWIVGAPEGNLNTVDTGWPNTIWTEWQDTRHGGRAPANVSTAALSVWCADCHNLNIGSAQGVGVEFGGKLHGDRTHPAPFIGGNSGPGQCYSCHRNDMGLDMNADNCDTCHLGPETYAQMRIDNPNAYFDFPHSGASEDYKMLGRATAYLDGEGAMQTGEVTTLTADNLDAVCLRCHTGIGTRH